MAEQWARRFSGSPDGEYRQRMLFDIHEPALVLSDAAQHLLFNSNTQWSLYLGTIPSIGLSESVRRSAAGDEAVPVHDVKLRIALPLHTQRAQAVAVMRELQPGAGDDAQNKVVVRQDRLVPLSRAPRGDEAAWGRRDRRDQWVNGVSIEITEPAMVARALATLKQSPQKTKIHTEYTQGWFEGMPPAPNEHFKKVLAECGVDLEVFGAMKFAQDSSLTHETALRSHLESCAPAAGRRVNP